VSRENSELIVMFIRIHNLRKDNGGQAAVFAALMLLVLVMFIMLVVDVGQLVSWRIRMQNATDSAAMAGAVWQARGLNVIAMLNILWVPAFIIDLIKLWFTGDVNFTITNLVQTIQDVMKYAVPVVAITQVVTYGRANKADIAVPLPTALAERLVNISSASDIKGIYDDGKSFYDDIKGGNFGLSSLTSLIPCWLNVDRAKYFLCASGWLGFMTGGEDVYTFSLAYKGSQPVLIGGSLLGINIPSIYTTAKAVPYGGCLGGGLPSVSEAADLVFSSVKRLVDGILKVFNIKNEGKTEEGLKGKLTFNVLPDPNYKAKFDKTGFERILMVH